MKKMLFVVVAALVCFVGSAQAADENTVVVFSSKVLSQYVGDTGAVFYHKPVAQSELTIAVGKGFYANIWTSVSLEDAGRNSNYGNEVDWTAGWSGETVGLTVDTGVSYFDLLPLFAGHEGDVVQPYCELSKEFVVAEGHTLTPSVKAEYGIAAQGNAVESKGFHSHVALKYGWQATEKAALSQKVVASFDDAAYGLERGWVGSYEAEASYALASWASIKASGKIITPLSDVQDGRRTEVIGGAGFALSY
jgi:hypothetical protein